MFLSIPRKISHVFEGVHVLVKTDLVLGKAREIQGAQKSLSYLKSYQMRYLAQKV